MNSLNWGQSDLFQLYYDTTPIIGTLDELVTKIDNALVDHAIKIGVCNIYHVCVYNMLHEKSITIPHKIRQLVIILAMHSLLPVSTLFSKSYNIFL